MKVEYLGSLCLHGRYLIIKTDGRSEVVESKEELEANYKRVKYVPN